MLFTSSTEEGDFAVHNRPSAIYKEILWYIQKNVKLKMCNCQIKLSLLVQIGRGMYTT